jgi:hypothetical protein
VENRICRSAAPAQPSFVIACAEEYSAPRQSQKEHAFPVGYGFAWSIDSCRLASRLACDAFAGVSNLSLFLLNFPSAQTVLDWGSAERQTPLIAARRAGTTQKSRAWALARQRCPTLVELSRNRSCKHRASRIRRRAAANSRSKIDVAIVNDIFNLNPTREAILRGLARPWAPAHDCLSLNWMDDV